MERLTATNGVAATSRKIIATTSFGCEKGTWFSESKLAITIILRLTRYWFGKSMNEFVMNDLKVNKNMIIRHVAAILRSQVMRIFINSCIHRNIHQQIMTKCKRKAAILDSIPATTSVARRDSFFAPSGACPEYQTSSEISYSNVTKEQYNAQVHFTELCRSPTFTNNAFWQEPSHEIQRVTNLKSHENLLRWSGLECTKDICFGSSCPLPPPHHIRGDSPAQEQDESNINVFRGGSVKRFPLNVMGDPGISKVFQFKKCMILFN
ncbi:hypothetical protein TNCV_3848341 [Trichonephila clavipes]|uniref:Uncharacterized protein n=1 Tax=Trichonephila clavipes TaxID=2585209 RepID=A0A8X6RCV0_TRICX|nr:hypothetical protein TNCV_3848341 [Trichonephila clavipes]